MTQVDLVPMPDAEVRFYSGFFDDAEASALLDRLLHEVIWTQETINMPGGRIPLPRLTAWYGDAGKSYRYSGLTVHPIPWIPTLLMIRERVEAASEMRFNSVLLNQYRDGRDSVSWHSDDEPELGTNPVIASVSLGAARAFQFKHRTTPDLRHSLVLRHGSLLLMGRGTQHHWKHQIPKTKTPLGIRINLTFRVIV